MTSVLLLTYCVAFSGLSEDPSLLDHKEIPKIVAQPVETMDKKGNIYWYVDGKLHREDGPAMITHNGSEYWYKNDQLHREDGPAILGIDANGNTFQEWWINGKRHRENGPAVISTDREYWYMHGVLHRFDWPAVDTCFGGEHHLFGVRRFPPKKTQKQIDEEYYGKSDSK